VYPALYPWWTRDVGSFRVRGGSNPADRVQEQAWTGRQPTYHIKGQSKKAVFAQFGGFSKKRQGKVTKAAEALVFFEPRRARQGGRVSQEKVFSRSKLMPATSPKFGTVPKKWCSRRFGEVDWLRSGRDMSAAVRAAKLRSRNDELPPPSGQQETGAGSPWLPWSSRSDGFDKRPQVGRSARDDNPTRDAIKAR
jgi:hypothetical protein